MTPDSRRYHFLSAVHLFLWRDGLVLLSRRFNTGYEDGNYSVPAGHLDGDETVVEAAIREAEEEIGAVIAAEDIEVVGVMHRRIGKQERIDFFVSVRRWAGEIGNREPDRCDDLRWSAPDGLPGNTIPYIRRALDNARTGRWFDSFEI
jgi:8-oxo-dGTP diphosphatase